MAKLSKRMKKVSQLVDRARVYALDEALGVMQKYSVDGKAKFDEAVELVMKLGVDPKHSDQVVRGVVAMPSGLGKEVRVAVFTKAERVDEAKKVGADIAGGEELIEEVRAGRLDFDLCIATPDMMPKVGTLGKVLGPKGLMPNPKLGTVSDDIAQAVRTAKAGQVEYKAEKAGLVHAGVGRLSFGADALKANIAALYNAVLAAKPSGAKGIYMQKIYLGTTMGPSIPIDLKGMLM